MSIKDKLVDSIDKSLCVYVDIKDEKIFPHEVEMVNNNLIVASTTSFRRQIITEPWENFIFFGKTQMNQDDFEKLGLAIGKVLAKKFVLSFEEQEIVNIG